MFNFFPYNEWSKQRGVVRVPYSEFYGDNFLLRTDGSVFDDSNGEILREPYENAKFVPLTEKEMGYVKFKLTVPFNAENIVEYRYKSIISHF